MFLLFGSIFKVLGWNPLIAFLLALFVALAVKFAFIDSWILVKMMVSYMEVAPNTVITFDLYDKLCALSSKFRELLKKGQQSEPAPAYTVAGNYPAGRPTAASVVGTPSGQPHGAGHALYCPACGAKQDGDTRFCGSCGTQISKLAAHANRTHPTV